MKIVALASMILPAQAAAQWKCCSHVKPYESGEEPACLTPLKDCPSAIGVEEYPVETCKIDDHIFPCTQMVFGVEVDGKMAVMNPYFDNRQVMMTQVTMPESTRGGGTGRCMSMCSKLSPVRYGKLSSTVWSSITFGRDRQFRAADDFVCWEQLEKGGLSPGLGFSNDWQNIQFDPSCGQGSQHTKCRLNCGASCEYFDADLCMRTCVGGGGSNADSYCAKGCLERVEECKAQGKVPGSALGEPGTEPVNPEKCNPKECEDWTCRDWCKCFKAHPDIIEIFEGPNPSADEQDIRAKCPADGKDDCDCTEFFEEGGGQ